MSLSAQIFLNLLNKLKKSLLKSIIKEHDLHQTFL